MEETLEDPPTSAVLLDHCHFSQVIFNSVEQFYVPGGDVTCYYTLTPHFVPRRKDWIGIFRRQEIKVKHKQFALQNPSVRDLCSDSPVCHRECLPELFILQSDITADCTGKELVGWKTTREYYTFMWVTVPGDLNSESTKQQEVQFKAYYLPKDDEYYQFCYVDQDGVVRGASTPFQFRPENEEDILVVTTQGEVEEIEQHNSELRRENQQLKDSCVSLQKQNSDLQAELQKKQEELETLKSINKELEQKVKEQQDSWGTELLHLKEQNQKMSSENEKMRVSLDQLQEQLLTQEKEMEKLVQGDQDKAEQLERLKRENSQLSLRLTEQREHQKKLEQTVAELKQKEATATKKQQELMDQNLDLSRRLSENKIICDVLQKEKERVERENDLLKSENGRLMSYMGLDFDSPPCQGPASDQGSTGQNPGLVYGNPYAGIQESSASSLLSSKKCPACKSDFTGDICDHTLEQQLVQTHYCPICDKSFSATEKQIFEDHMFCHSL